MNRRICRCGKPEGAGTTRREQPVWPGVDFNECMTQS
jgi:hypothetical protein